MQSNDFDRAAVWLSDDFTLDWPQSRERISGRVDFSAVNTAYPASGIWQFDVLRLLADGDRVVTEVAITDGDMAATAITFHTVQDGRITHQTEYWPDPYPAPHWRAKWVTPIL